MKDPTMVYRGMDRAALDAAYNNTAAVGVPRRDQYVADWTARSEAVLRTPGAKIDLRYGDGPRQRLDFVPCGRPGAPTLAYIHGGDWQMNDKEADAFFGESLLPAGHQPAVIQYTPGPGWRARSDRGRGARRDRVDDRARRRTGRRPAPRVRRRALGWRASDRRRDERCPRRRRHRHQRDLRSRTDPPELSERQARSRCG